VQGTALEITQEGVEKGILSGEQGAGGEGEKGQVGGHCREKAEHLLLNTQPLRANSDSSEALAAQYRAHCERRAAYTRGHH
jgi:hypothetical protein